jgi:hypothetical protein
MCAAPQDDILWKALPETSLTLIPYIFIGSIFTFLYVFYSLSFAAFSLLSFVGS